VLCRAEAVRLQARSPARASGETGRAGTAPSRSPRARLAARASLVRWLISRRSYCEAEMMMLAAIAPAGVAHIDIKVREEEYLAVSSRGFD
jgi:hypothetical protein